jgi:hypothetical protein
MSEFDRDIELEIRGRKRFINGFTVDDANRLRQSQNLRLAVDGRKPGARQRLVEWRCTSIEDRRLGAIHLDHYVIDPGRCYGGKNVFYCVDGVIAAPELSAALSLGDLIYGCPYRWGILNVETAKLNSVA